MPEPTSLVDVQQVQATGTTYDRRGNSRSPRPAGWTQTSLAEQADDAAALLATLGQRPAVVVGTSAGGSIALELALRHPRRSGQRSCTSPPSWRAPPTPRRSPPAWRP